VISEVSGYATLKGDGSVLTEWVGGAAAGLRDGTVPMSNVVMRGSRVVSADLRTQGHGWAWDTSLGGIRRIVREDWRGLRPHELDEIAGMLELLSEGSLDLVMEWLFEGDELWFWDLTAYSTSPPATNCISLRHAKGPALFLDDTAALDELASGRSVRADNAFRHACRSERGELIRIDILNLASPPIVVTQAPKPSLALIADIVLRDSFLSKDQHYARSSISTDPLI
jgi:hypothetical protein